jgi:hypothetical protein
MKQRRIEEGGQSAASAAFAGGGGVLEKGFAASASSAAASLHKAKKGEIERIANVTLKWQQLLDYQKTLWSRHDVKGHPLNYCERYNTLAKFVTQDIVIAYQKILCVDAILPTIFGLNPPSLDKPTADSEDYLGTLVTHVRAILDQIDRASAEEIEFDHVVYVAAPRAIRRQQDFYRFGQGGLRPFVEGSGAIRLDLSGQSEFPGYINRLRMRAIGLSMSVGADPALFNPRTAIQRAAAAVFPPAGRAPVIIEDIGVTRPAGAPLNTTNQIMNVDPRGVWNIQLSSNLGLADNLVHHLEYEWFTDIKLHLRLRATVDRDFNKWANFSW